MKANYRLIYGTHQRPPFSWNNNHFRKLPHRYAAYIDFSNLANEDDLQQQQKRRKDQQKNENVNIF